MTLELPLATERLDLRAFTTADLDDVHAYRSLPEVVAYLYWGAQTREQVEAKLAEDATLTDLRGDKGAKLAVVERESGTVIGEVSVFGFSPELRSAEIGYVFHPAHGGKGYASEAVRALLRAAFEDHGLHRVFARCDFDNAASWRLMERIGMRREAKFLRNEIMPYSKDRPDPWTTELVYALLDEEWTGS
ncbi:GNAT family N-acetyltransferase [Phytomonospora endophytica]|uniref:RimJ/RimL family protein N-acetyltransferase n=1 Tax=Phytomonospora endophytica TaxID=714109 RepID=A0A841FHK4_9ACTN|nr:GNAT family N-acetyltransferase [Phytomonospora endophytica]MBB6035696.1 RimJ/RimL family protein N-acetyltransferase [Phytomonospora endophytica]GIG69627.1 N-acetyltransferase [Phytomonospora endophytica]